MSDLLWSCRLFIVSLPLILILNSCQTSRSLLRLNELEPVVNVGIPEVSKSINRNNITTTSDFNYDGGDTLIINGKNTFLMKAVKNESDGEMIANQTLSPASVTADFKNVAERGGKVNISFDLKVPKEMFNREWQIRIYPTLFLERDTIDLDDIFITGDKYRAKQLKGYELYEKFISSILNEGEDYFKNFVDQRNLEIFIERNLPQLYSLKDDTSDVVISDSLITAFGVGYQEIVDHYTYWSKLKRNRKKIESIDDFYAKYVKSPILKNNIKLDSVINNIGEGFHYHYSEYIPLKRREKKIVLEIRGDIWRDGEKIYTIPPTPPLSYYVSSLSSLIDNNILNISHLSDTLYRYGISSIESHNYKDAINALKDYKDYNTALAYLALDYNQSAERILKITPRNDKVYYLLSIVYARLGRDALSRSNLWKAIELNPALRHRANLDPELSGFIE